MVRRGRPQDPVSGRSGLLRQFAEELRDLRVQAGNPTYREMEAVSGLSKATLSKTVSGRRLPTVQAVCGYVRACGGDETEWAGRLEHLTAALANAARPAPPDRRSPAHDSVHLPVSPLGTVTHRSRSGGTVAGTPHPPNPADPTPACSVWSLPWGRNVHFVGRAAELSSLRSRLAGEHGSGLPQVLHGLGGVGKSQLAVEYAYAHAGDYDLVWWVAGEQPAGVVASLAELAEQLGVAVTGDADQSARAATTALGAGRIRSRWLVVVDNAGTPTDFHGLLSAAARAEGGHLLLTSRDRGWSRVAEPTEVCELPRPDAVALLRARAPQLTSAEAARIADAVGCLPLALDQAGSWLAETSMSAPAYIKHIETRVQDIMRRSAPPDHVSVEATITATLEELDDAAAVMLMRLWAQFAPEPIAVDLIHPGVADGLPAPLDAAARDPLALGDLIARLTRVSLVRPVAGNAVVMHRMVRALLQATTPRAQHADLRKAAHRILAAAHPDRRTTPAGWRAYSRLHPHALATDLVTGTTGSSRDLVLWLVWALRAAGDYPNSRHLAQQAHRRWAATLGPAHLDTVLAAANLAATMWAQSQPMEAQQTLPLPLLNQGFRADAPDAIAVGPAGGTAAGTTEDLVARFSGIFDADHPHVITVSAHIAATSWALGDHPRARSAFQDVYQRASRVLGADHPHTIRAAAYLGSTLVALKEYPAARTLLEDVTSRARRTLGEDHPDVVRAAVGLAATLAAQHDPMATPTLLADLLCRARRVLGETHPETVRVRALLE